MIFWYFSDRYCIEFLIVHVFDDKLGIFDSYDDTYMSVVGIVSMSFELYDSTNSWSFTSRYSLCFCITYPLICISSPCHALILCDIGSTVSPRESSIEACISNLICFCSWFCRRGGIEQCLRLLRCCFLVGSFCCWFLWGFCDRLDGGFIYHFLCHDFLLILLILSYKTDWLTRSSNNNNLTDWKFSFEEFAII